MLVDNSLQKHLVAELVKLRELGISRLDELNASGQPRMPLPLLEEASEMCEGYNAGMTRSDAVANLLRREIGNLDDPGHRVWLPVSLGVKEGLSTTVPKKLNEMAADLADRTDPEDFKRTGRKLQRAFQVLAAQIAASRRQETTDVYEESLRRSTAMAVERPVAFYGDSRILAFAPQIVADGNFVAVDAPFGQNVDYSVEVIISDVLRDDFLRLAQEYDVPLVAEYIAHHKEGVEEESDAPDGDTTGIWRWLNVQALMDQISDLPRDCLTIRFDGSRPDRFILDVADFLFTYLQDEEKEVWLHTADDLLRTFQEVFLGGDPRPAPVLWIYDLDDVSQVRQMLDYLDPRRVIITTPRVLTRKMTSFEMPARSEDELRKLLLDDTEEPSESKTSIATLRLLWLDGNELAALWLRDRLLRRPSWNPKLDDEVGFIARCAKTAEDMSYRERLWPGRNSSVPTCLRAIASQIVMDYRSEYYATDADNFEAILATLCCLSSNTFNEDLLSGVLGSRAPSVEFGVYHLMAELERYGIVDDTGDGLKSGWAIAPGVAAAFREVLSPSIVHSTVISLLKYMKVDTERRLKTPMTRDKWLEHSSWLRHCFEACDVLASLDVTYVKTAVGLSTPLGETAPQWPTLV